VPAVAIRLPLLKRTAKLGGQINAAAVPPHKYEIGSLITTQTYEAEKLGVEIITGVCVDADLSKTAIFDEVIVATGANTSSPIFPVSISPW